MRINRSMIPYIASYVIGTGLLVGGIISVPKEEQCDATNTYHVHLFTKDIENTRIKKWLQREKNSSYTKQDDFLPATTLDLTAFDKLDDYHLFDGKDNLDFVNYQINHNRDYLKFYYYYEEIRYEKDSQGNSIMKTDTYEGWTRNPRHRGVNGKTRVYHTRYYAYNLVYKEGNLELEKSEDVDDVREILNEYPYIGENTNHDIYETFYFSRFELPYLDLEEFDPFYTPTVENNPLEKEEAPQLIKAK